MVVGLDVGMLVYDDGLEGVLGLGWERRERNRVVLCFGGCIMVCNNGVGSLGGGKDWRGKGRGGMVWRL